MATSWISDEWFLAPDVNPAHPVLDAARSYVEHAGIEKHEFFRLAARSPEALKAWASQELVVTGPFAQYLLLIAASIPNVHLRSIVVRVLRDEHGGLTKQLLASRSHPWLLHRLAISIGVDPASVRPFEETCWFLDELKRECGRSTIRGLAAIGMGSEALLVPEYSAVRAAFAKAMPEASFAPFLDANLRADTDHTRLLEVVSGNLIATDSDANDYLEAARKSVDDRLVYYDRLTKRLKSIGLL
jgi:hypothetical protein